MFFSLHQELLFGGSEDEKSAVKSWKLQEQRKDGKYIPLDKAVGNKIRVYFKTNEVFSLPVIFHATYYTDSSRKEINIEHNYNRYVTEQAAGFFIKDILPLISEKNPEDPAKHLDILNNQHELIEGTVNKFFMDSIFNYLKNYPIFPNIEGVLCKAEDIKRLSIEENLWDELYELLSEEGAKEIDLIHPCL